MTGRQTSHSQQETGSSRLFLGIPLADDLREALARHLDPHQLPGRLVPPDKWHLTLRFLGDTSQEMLGALLGTLRTAVLGDPFEITFDKLGAFPLPARAAR